jgi:hypothetical protein
LRPPADFYLLFKAPRFGLERSGRCQQAALNSFAQVRQQFLARVTFGNAARESGHLGPLGRIVDDDLQPKVPGNAFIFFLAGRTGFLPPLPLAE